MKMAKVSSTCEGRGKKRGIGGEEESSRMCAKARKSGYEENAGALSSACMERVMTRRMLREALDEEERRVTEMLTEQERRYKEMLMERERSAIFVDIEKIEVIMIEDEEEEVSGKKDEEKKEGEAIGYQALAEEKVEEVAAGGGGGGGVSEKQEESGLEIDPDDWGWTWSCEEKQIWWESGCYPYWETMCFDNWVNVDDQELPWEDDLWNLLDIKEVPKDLKK